MPCDQEQPLTLDPKPPPPRVCLGLRREHGSVDRPRPPGKPWRREGMTTGPPAESPSGLTVRRCVRLSGEAGGTLLLPPQIEVHPQLCV